MSDIPNPSIIPVPIENERDRVPDNQKTDPHFGNADYVNQKPRDDEPEHVKPF